MTTSTGDPVMIAPDGGRLITGGAVHARLLVAHDHPSYASTFEMTVAPGFDVGAHVHTNGEEVFYVVDGELDVLCFEPTDRTPADWHAWTDALGRPFLRGLPGAFLYVPPGSRTPSPTPPTAPRPSSSSPRSPAGTRTTSPSSGRCCAPATATPRRPTSSSSRPGTAPSSSRR